MIQSRTIGLLAATRPELEATAQRLGLIWEGRIACGTWDDHTIIATVSGVGRERAVRGLHVLFEQEEIHVVIHMGFAAGLDPALQAGQLLHVSRVHDESSRSITLPSPKAEPTGTLLSVNRLITTTQEKRQLHERHHTHAADMEAYAIAETLLRLRVPLIGVRAISDPADTALPGAALHWLQPDGRTRPFKAATWLAQHPTQFGTLRRLARYTRLASNALAQAMPGIIEDVNGEMPPQRTEASERPAPQTVAETPQSAY